MNCSFAAARVNAHAAAHVARSCSSVLFCSIYGQYPNQCQLYPLVPKDLEEIEEPCGYTFQ
jgi:hypothetical protein